MKRSRRLWVYNLILLLCFSTAAPAQEQPTFRDAVEVRVINVDVFVEDRDGNRVYGLTPDDFILLENGKSQPITNFSEYRSGRNSDLSPVTGGVRMETAAPEVVTSSEERQPRTVIFFVDTFHQQPRDREDLFNQIRSFLREGFGPGDRAALLTWRKTTQEVVPLTDDLRRIDQGLAALAGLQLPETEPGLDALRDFFEFSAEAGAGGPTVAEQMEFVTRNCADDYLNEMKAKTHSLERVIRSISGIEGRKSFVYVASRFPANTHTYCTSTERSPRFGPPVGTYSTDKLVDAVASAANAAGVTFYPIRPTLERRATAAEHAYAADELGTPNTTTLGDQIGAFNDADALATLAERTGGRLAAGDWMIDELIPEIIADLDDYYSLGYRASSDGSDRRRDISVRMKNRNYRVRSRETFVEKSRLTEVKDQLLANLLGDPVPGEITLEVIEKEPRKARRGRTVLPIEIRIPLDQILYSGQNPTSRIRLLSAAGDTPGTTSAVSEAIRRIEKPPADLPSPYLVWEVDVQLAAEGGKASFGVLDEVSGLAGFATIDRTTETLERLEIEQKESLDRWQQELYRRHRTGKPILVYLRPEPCTRREGFNTISVCEDFEREVLADPRVEQKLQELELLQWEPDGHAAAWPETEAGLALVRVDGHVIARWNQLPDATGLLRSIDIILSRKDEMLGINTLAREGHEDLANFSTALLQSRFGLREEAISLLETLSAKSADPATAEIAAVQIAFLEAAESRSRALSKLHALSRDASQDVARAEAWLAIAALTGGDEKIESLQNAMNAAPEGSPQKAAAQAQLQKIRAGDGGSTVN